MAERRTNLALLGLTTGAVATGALNFGRARGGGRRYGPLRDLQIHVGAGLVALALVVWHVADTTPWWWQPPYPID